MLSQAQPDDVSADMLRASAPEARAEISGWCGLRQRVCRAVPPWSMMAVWIRGSTTRRLRVREDTMPITSGCTERSGRCALAKMKQRRLCSRPTLATIRDPSGRGDPKSKRKVRAGANIR